MQQTASLKRQPKGKRHQNATQNTPLNDSLRGNDSNFTTPLKPAVDRGSCRSGSFSGWEEKVQLDWVLGGHRRWAWRTQCWPTVLKNAKTMGGGRRFVKNGSDRLSKEMGREEGFRERELETELDFQDLERERVRELVMKVKEKQRKHMVLHCRASLTRGRESNLSSAIFNSEPV
ncbi:hypothetical protein TIFTF001_002560 [Ficus carica]|uniref:Uncharacterized protein n=1 Tax=Ficus carica TaxID=3494 RepID=A0AA87Z5C1_FICCA|nr:hypothetical protein TIFTF001_002560 [Ficus carica]